MAKKKRDSLGKKLALKASTQKCPGLLLITLHWPQLVIGSSKSNIKKTGDLSFFHRKGGNLKKGMQIL